MNTIRAKLTLDGNTLTVEDKPTPVISGWGAGVEVMTDGYTGLGEIKGYEGNNDKIYGFGNDLVIKAEYDFIVAIEETKFDAITLYALDYANGGVMLPESVKFVVGDKTYDAVITANENGIATITAELGEEVTASEIKVMVVMGESPYDFGIFNMFTEITVNVVEDEPIDPPVEPEPTVEEKMQEALGNAFEDAKFDLVVHAPMHYQAGDEITVTVIVNNITAVNGLHLVEFKFYYDNEKLVLINDLDEHDENALLCIENLPKGWENLSHVANDYNPENAGAEVNPLNDGVITAIALTDSESKAFAITENGALKFTFTFKALEDANGDLGFVIPHAEANGGFNTDTLYEFYTANGGYEITHQAAVLEGKDATCTEEGLTEGLYCVNCGKILVEQEPFAPLGHSEEWVTVVEPGYGTPGWEECRCTVCGEVLEAREIPALFMLGDVNCDGEIEKYDYVLVKRAIMGTYGLNEYEQAAADIDGNGIVNVYDYVLIRRHILGTFTIGK